MFFSPRASNYAAQLARIILPELLALAVQAPHRCIQLIRRTSPRPIDIVMADRDQNQIGEPLRSQQLIDLSGKIPRAKDAAKKILPLRIMIDQRADAGTFDRNERRDLFQSFRNAANPWLRRTVIEKPVASATSVRAPERAPTRRDVRAHAGAVAKHGNVRQPSDQLSFRDLTISIRQVI